MGFKFETVFKRGITTIRDIYGKPYEVKYTYGKLSNNHKVLDYGVGFSVNINGEDCGLFVPIKKSFVDSKYTDSVIKEAFKTFKKCFRFTLKDLKNKY